MAGSSAQNRFGDAIRDLRERKGFTRKEVAGRITTYYSDDSAYGRVEQGRRAAKRDSALAILVDGLLMIDPVEVNSYLALAGFEGLTEDEAKKFKFETAGIRPPTAPMPSPSPVVPSTLEKIAAWPKPTGSAAALVLCALLLAGVLASRSSLPVWFSLLTSVLYAGLYVISVLLEGAYGPLTQKLVAACVVVFAFILMSSTIAIVADDAAVQSGQTYGLFFSLAIFTLSAVLQGMFVRDALPPHPIVRARFVTHTAQAAHLKNTAYFLAIVFVFWVPPTHCVSTLLRLQISGQGALIAPILSHPIIVSEGVICMNILPLWVLVLFTLGASLFMRSRILDNLRPSPNLNRFLILFYVRAALYFALVFLSVGWFTTSIGALQP